jgi:hypothetical protein
MEVCGFVDGRRLVVYEVRWIYVGIGTMGRR